ncbi:MAG: hypothetical protein WCX65_05340 [bacterium]
MKPQTDKDIQIELCLRHGTQYYEAPEYQKIGIANNIKSGLQPINGLRHPPKGDASGWYIWAGGKLSTDLEFFAPLHISHLKEWCPSVIKYLGLPPGWRFLIAGEHEDIWEDASLLNI